MVIIYMKIQQTLAIVLLLALTILTRADNPDANAGTASSLFDQPPKLELMDLTDLIKALGVTYEQLAHNISTSDDSTASSTASLAAGKATTTSSSTLDDKKPQTYTHHTPPKKDDSQIAKLSADAPKTTNPQANKPSDDSKATAKTNDNVKYTITNDASNKKSTDTKTKTSTQTEKIPPPTNYNPPPTPTPTRAQTQTPTQAQTQTQTPTRKPTQASTSTQTPPRTTTTTTATTPSTITSNAPTAFGPGPQDKKLPPVIDISKLVVQTPSVPSTPAKNQNLQPNQINYKPTTTTPTPAAAAVPAPVSTPTPVQTQPTVSDWKTSQTDKIQTNNAPSYTITQKKPENRKPSTDDDYVVKPTIQPIIPTPTPTPTPTPVATPTPTPMATPTPTPVATPTPTHVATRTPTPTAIATTIATPIATSNPSFGASSQQRLVPTLVNQNNVNEVYIAPVASTPIIIDKPEPKPALISPALFIRDNDSPVSNNLVSEERKEVSVAAASYQCWNYSPDAIYNITANYKAFSKYFIITNKDEYLSNIQSYLLSNYGNYISGSQTIAGFRLYNTYGDNSLEYQLLISTNYGIFVSILTYWPVTGNIQLKSLSILNFFIMEIDYYNCQEPDSVKQNCKVCEEGFRNFFGRCRPYDGSCTTYLSDECGRCEGNRRLLNGICQ